VEDNMIVLGELWSPCNKDDWLEGINEDEIGNFIKVKEGKRPSFKKQMNDNGKSKLIVIFANDIVSKLHKGSNCKMITEQQFKNFYYNYKTLEDGNSIWYYAFNNVKNWKQNGGCVLVPQCPTENCNIFGCQIHLNNNIKIKPKKYTIFHFCGYTNKNDYVCLLSGRQMVIESWMKTSSIKSLNLTVNDEDLFRECMNKIYQ
jgi:hypothetical protein